MRSPSQYSFAVAPSVQMPRSAFRQDRTYKSAFDAGFIVPFFHEEILPGDTLNVNTTAFARLSTPIVPFMDNLHMDFHFFFVPYRLLWDHWVNMCGEQDNPSDSTDYLTPIMADTSVGYEVGHLYDYLGFPVGVPHLRPTVWLPRAYNKIWNDHYRDENLQDSVPEHKDDGPDPIADYHLLRRGKRKDYFTSGLPWPQKGPGASISLGTTAPVSVFGTGGPLNLQAAESTGWFHVVGSDSFSGLGDTHVRLCGTSATDSYTSGGALKVATRQTLGSSGLQGIADLSEATAVTINSLREAFQVQKLWERDARGGTRYGELILSHFGVQNPDSRLQRSEYLGGGSIPIQIHSVAQTSSSDSTSPQGNLAAYGVSSGKVGFSKSFTEHGVVLGCVSVRADLTYQQGLRRAWSRRSRFDYYWPSLAHLGEQSILCKELRATGTADDDKVFAYQERWAELRYGFSHITGKLRSGVPGSLDVWHLAQYFENTPELNYQFIHEDPPLSRVLAVQDEPQIIFDSLSTVNFVRCLPIYSVPGLVDHF